MIASHLEPDRELEGVVLGLPLLDRESALLETIVKSQPTEEAVGATVQAPVTEPAEDAFINVIQSTLGLVTTWSRGLDLGPKG